MAVKMERERVMHLSWKHFGLSLRWQSLVDRTLHSQDQKHVCENTTQGISQFLKAPNHSELCQHDTALSTNKWHAPGSKLTYLFPNLFHCSLLAPTWTAFSDYTGLYLLCSIVFNSFLIIFLSFYFGSCGRLSCLTVSMLIQHHHITMHQTNGLPRWLSWLRHSAHRPERSAVGAGFNIRVGR